MTLEIVRLADYCEIVSGATPRRDHPEYWGGDIAWVTPKDIRDLDGAILADTPEHITQTGYDSCSTRLLPKRSVLFSSRAPIGLVAITGREMCTNQGFKSLIPGPDVDAGYLYWCLKREAPRIAAKSSGTTFTEISRKGMEQVKIPLPPLPEQRRIAAILDKADAVRRKRQRTLDLADQFLRSVFLDLFGDPVTNPKGWPQRQVQDLCRVVRGSSPRPKADPRYYGGPVPRLMVADITRDGWFVTPRIDSLTEGGAKLSRPLPKGTVVMVVSGDVGVVAMLEIDACIHDGFVGFPDLEKSDLLPEYFLLTLHFLKATHEQRRAGAIWQNLTTHDIKRMRVAIPPLAIQERSLHILAGLRKVGEREALAIRETESLASSLTQRAFRGEL